VTRRWLKLQYSGGLVPDPLFSWPFSLKYRRYERSVGRSFRRLWLLGARNPRTTFWSERSQTLSTRRDECTISCCRASAGLGSMAGPDVGNASLLVATPCVDPCSPLFPTGVHDQMFGSGSISMYPGSDATNQTLRFAAHCCGSNCAVRVADSRMWPFATTRRSFWGSAVFGRAQCK
jgi:hypothetical protein